MLDALEAKWKFDIPCCHLVIGFLVGFAPFLLNRYEVGKNGWTSFERCKGERARIVGIEFGESVMWKKTFGGGAVGKLSSNWNDGYFWVYVASRASTSLVRRAHGRREAYRESLWENVGIQDLSNWSSSFHARYQVTPMRTRTFLKL